MDSHGLLLLLTSLSDAMALPSPFLGGSDMTWCLARCPPRRSPRSRTTKESRDRWYFVRHPNHMHKRRQTVWCVEERLAAGMASRGQLSSFFLNCGLERQGLDSPSAPSRTGWHPTRINRGSLDSILLTRRHAGSKRVLPSVNRLLERLVSGVQVCFWSFLKMPPPLKIPQSRGMVWPRGPEFS
jgi:hypothetical protein